MNESIWSNRTSQISAGVHPGGASGKEPTCQCIRCGFHPWVRKIPWRRAWQPTPVFLPGESHGQRSLAGSSPCGCTVLNMTEATSCAKLTLSSESYGEIWILFFWTLGYKILKPGTFAAISYRKSKVILRKNKIFRENNKKKISKGTARFQIKHMGSQRILNRSFLQVCCLGFGLQHKKS